MFQACNRHGNIAQNLPQSAFFLFLAFSEPLHVYTGNHNSSFCLSGIDISTTMFDCLKNSSEETFFVLFFFFFFFFFLAVGVKFLLAVVFFVSF